MGGGEAVVETTMITTPKVTSQTPDNMHPPVDRSVARSRARDIAGLLGTRAVAHDKNSWGEPSCPYKIPLHADDFWFSIFVSDTTYRFTGNHKRGHGEPAHFCLTLKTPWLNMHTTEHNPVLSREFQVPVFLATHMPPDAAQHLQQCESFRQLLKKVDFSSISRVFLNASQIHVWSESIEPTQCAQQVVVFRSILQTVHHHFVAWSLNRVDLSSPLSAQGGKA